MRSGLKDRFIVDTTRPHILVSNDDGIHSAGLVALYKALSEFAEVTVLAPDHNWSAAGHAKTMHKPLRMRRAALADGTPAFSSDGAPSDCVALALLGVIESRPNLVISGINAGPNLGADVTYSGTVAAAMEAAIWGLPAIAVSQDLPPPQADGSRTAVDFGFAASAAARIARQVLKHGLPRDTLLNVNVPARPPDQIQGIQITRLGRREYRDILITRQDPRGQPYYWIGGELPAGLPEEGTDIGALERGFVSVTPLGMDMTDRQALAQISAWEFNE